MNSARCRQLLGELEDFLARPGLLLSAETRESLLERTRELTTRFVDLDDRITVGLIGGTGVGKSTLVNALAGEVVSRPGDRRPTTDRVVLYRHRRTNFELPEDVPWSEVTHEVETLERIAVLDLPDPDSDARRHREILDRVLPAIDLVVVLADDMKYADRCLYEVLDALPQAGPNRIYLLNKVDQLEMRYGEEAEEVERTLLADFRDRLRERGHDPEADPWPASALRAFEAGGPDGDPEGTGRLWQALEALQEERRRLQIKEANLAGATLRLVDEVAASVDPEEAVERVGEVARPLESAQEALDPERASEDALGLTLRQGYFALGRDRILKRLPFPWGRLAALGWRGKPLAEAEIDRIELEERLRPWRLRREDAWLLVRDEARRAFRGEALPPEPPAPDVAAIAEQVTAELGRDLDRLERRIGRRWSIHLAPIAVLILGIIAEIHAPLSKLVSGESGWSDFFAVALAPLRPVFLVALALAALLAYVLTLLARRQRLRLALEARFRAAQSAVASALDETRQADLAWAEALREQVRREAAEVAKLIEPVPAARRPAVRGLR